MSRADSGPLVVIVGETASGKSALAVELAELLNGEIICADSWTVRREVNIGTAKPTIKEQERVPHHLLDIVGPCEDFTAAVFKRLAKKAINDITARGKLPIMVGGTGLYIDGVIYDFGFLPEGDRTAREALNALSNVELLADIKQRGIELRGIDIRNKRRLIRLIETNGKQPTKQALRPNTAIIGLKVDQNSLRQRVTQRVQAMLTAGLQQEVKLLSETYGWGCEALKGVGYAQWKNFFEGRQTIEQTEQDIIRATLNLAKRQRTWFERNNSIHWIHIPVNREYVVGLITTLLNT